MVISLYITVLIVRGCFDRMYRFKKIILAPDARTLLQRNYDKLSHIFFYAYYLYIITDFSPAVWNKYSLVNILKDHKLHSPHGLVQFLLVFEKIYCLFIPNRTRNHVISYANDHIFMVLKAFD